jgi:hypothetical protein
MLGGKCRFFQATTQCCGTECGAMIDPADKQTQDVRKEAFEVYRSSMEISPA